MRTLDILLVRESIHKHPDDRMTTTGATYRA